MKFGGSQPEFSPTSYFACLQEMLQQQLNTNNTSIEALMYAYSAIVSMLDSGVVANQEKKIVEAATFVIQSGRFSPSAVKYSVMCLQFVLGTKSVAQWQSQDDSSGPILSLIFSQALSTHQSVFQQAVKTLCIILQNNTISAIPKVQALLKQFIDGTVMSVLGSQQRNANTNQVEVGAQQQAVKLLNFLSGVLQLLPVDLCA